MKIIPINQKDAQTFVNKYHRHHKSPAGSIFQIGLENDNKLIGVIIVGRPISRILDNSLTLEVTRLCTDGTKNACSKLYAAAWRVTKNLGYTKLITYILDTENGTSLKAVNWNYAGVSKGKSWNCKSRPRTDKIPIQNKLKFEIT